MVKFAHLADCHLGSWRQEDLQRLNFESFQKALSICIREAVDFIIIAGDLFDSAYPPIDILKEAFAEFKKVHDAKIPVYLVAGSHDFSASGKTFLDVLEKAGFCKNVENYEVLEDGRIKLKAMKHQNVAIFGYSGKKSGMEIEDLRKVFFEADYPFSIFVLHTTLKDVVGNLPMDSIEKQKLPLANYYALGHIHQVFQTHLGYSQYVYPGPIFPNNFQELNDLKCGSFELVNIENGKVLHRNIKIPTKEIDFVDIDLEDGLTATDEIIDILNKRNLKDKIVLMRLTGILKRGKSGDIRFHEIEEFVVKKGAYSFLRNISSLTSEEMKIRFGSGSSDDMEKVEERVIEDYKKENPADYNKYLIQLMSAFSAEKNEDENSSVFENRLNSELEKILDLKEVLR